MNKSENKMIPESFKKKRDEAADRHAEDNSSWGDCPGCNNKQVGLEQGFKAGADFGYLEGCYAMTRNILDYLEESRLFLLAEKVERQFLKKEDKNE